MAKRQKWIFENFQLKLSHLKPEVQEMAIEIAGKLMENNEYSEEEALEIGIKRAEEWYLNMGG